MEEINLYKLLGYYVRNWLLILSITLTGLVAGLVYNQFIQTPMYKSNATLLVIKEAGAAQDTTLLNNYVQLFQSRRVLEPVIKSQNLDMTYEQLSSGVSAVNEKNTEVLQVSVSTKNPEVSQKFLAAAVDSFRAQVQEIYNRRNVTVVDNASDAEPPFNVNKPLQLAIATGAGFVVSLLVLFFIYDAKGGNVEKRGKKKVKATKKPALSQTPKQTKQLALPEVAKLNPVRKAGAAGKKTTKQLASKLKNSAKSSLWIEEQPLDEPNDESARPTTPKKTKK